MEEGGEVEEAEEADWVGEVEREEEAVDEVVEAVDCT